MLLRLLLVSLFLIQFSGCGYTFQGGRSVLPQSVKTVYIPPIENFTTDPLIGTLLTEALRERFDRYGVVRVVGRDESPSAELRVRLLQLQSRSQSATAAGDVAQQLMITASAAGELEQRGGLILWRSPSISSSKVFGNTAGSVVQNSAGFAEGGLASGDLGGLNQREVTRSQERESLQAIADDIALQVYEQAVSPDF